MERLYLIAMIVGQMFELIYGLVVISEILVL